MAKARHRFQFFKRGLSQAQRLGAAGDFLLPSIAPNCITDLAWGASADCQSFFPNGPADAIAAIQQQQPGCMPDTSSMTSKMSDLQANWNPTGTYAPNDLAALVNKVLAMIAVPYTQVAVMQTSGSGPTLDTAVLSDVATQGQAYLADVQTAKAQGNNAINAPGLKVWVLGAFSAAINMMNTIGSAACERPFWSSALASFESAVADVWNFAKSVGGLALDLAKAAYNTTAEAIGFIGWLVKWAPWIAGGLLVAGVGFYIWNHRTQTFPSLLPGSH